MTKPGPLVFFFSGILVAAVFFAVGNLAAQPTSTPYTATNDFPIPFSCTVTESPTFQTCPPTVLINPKTPTDPPPALADCVKEHDFASKGATWRGLRKIEREYPIRDGLWDNIRSFVPVNITNLKSVTAGDESDSNGHTAVGAAPKGDDPQPNTVRWLEVRFETCEKTSDGKFFELVEHLKFPVPVDHDSMRVTGEVKEIL